MDTRDAGRRGRLTIFHCQARKRHLQKKLGSELGVSSGAEALAIRSRRDRLDAAEPVPSVAHDAIFPRPLEAQTDLPRSNTAAAESAK